MKKALSVLFVTLLACAALSACGGKKAASAAAKFEPGYFAYSYDDEIDGQKIECKDYLILLDDGKGFYSAQDTVDLTWNWTVAVCADGTKMSIKPDGDNLTVTQDGQNKTFVRTYEDLPDDLYDKIEENLNSREFEGKYKSDSAEITLTKTSAGIYDVVFSAKGIDEVKGEGNIVDGGVEIGFTDPNGKDFYSVFFPLCDTYTLRVTQSEWDKIKPQTDFEGFVKQ